MSTPQGPQFQPQPGPQQQPYGQPYAPQQPVPVQPAAAKPKRFGWLAIGIAAFVALLLGIAIGNSGNGTPAASAVPSPAPTVTVTAPAPAAAPTSEVPTDSSTFTPKKSEFQVSIKITEKQCFGSAGCNITFKPKLAYGLDEGDLPSEGVTSVTYEVSGTEDTFTGTLELSGDGSYTGGDEQDVSTSSSGKKLVAKVTDVSYNQYG